MQDEQSRTWQVGIPCRRLTVLQQVVLVVVSLIINNVCVAALVLQGLHAADGLRSVQFYGGFPSCHPALVAGVASRTVAVAVV